MDRTKILLCIQNVFRNIFDDDGLILTEDTDRNELEEWDSIASINLAFGIEDEFSINIQAKDFAEIKSIKDLVTIIEKKVK